MKVPENTTKEEKNNIKEYNKHVKAERKIAVPPVYEPLRLCCDLLFGLAEKLDISTDEKQKIDNMLHYQGENLFLDQNLDNMYRFNVGDHEITKEDVQVTFDGGSFTIPAQYVSEISSVCVTVDGQKITDWTVNEVDRNKSKSLDNFVVTYISETAGDVKYSDGAVIIIEILASDYADNPMTFTFVAETTSVVGITVSTKFVRG